MKVLLEIEDANKIKFDSDKRYHVLKNFKNSELLGFASITKEDNKLYAEINTRYLVDDLYPAIGYQTIADNKEDNYLGEVFAIGLSETENTDKSIPKVKDNGYK